MALQDKIGRSEIINKICYLVDSLQKDGHFCLSINGEWGSGKTFVMQMISDKLKKHEEYLLINFDAWKNNFYPDPLIAILYCILDTLQNKFYLAKDNKAYTKIIKQSIKKTAGEKLSDIIEKLYLAGAWYAVCGFAIDIIKNIINQAKSSILDNKLFDDYKSYQSLLSDSITILNSLTTFEEFTGKQTRLIILVDEIDRCLPNEQLLVLERLHHLFNVKNCAVLVALNKDSISTAFNHSYGGEGSLYLKKFFDYNFKLETNYQSLLKNSLNDLLDELNEHLRSENLLTKQDTEYVGKYLIDMCDHPSSDEVNDENYINFNNRECKRLLDAAINICKKVPAADMNYCYLWFIFVMTFEKLYGTDFNVYKDGRVQEIADLRSVPYLYDKLRKRFSIPYKKRSIPIFDDKKANHLNFMFNEFTLRNNSREFDILAISWVNQAEIKEIWDIKNLEKITEWIDNYS